MNLLYATVRSFPQHSQAKAWLAERLAGDPPLALAHVALFGFVRIRAWVRPATLTTTSNWPRWPSSTSRTALGGCGLRPHEGAPMA
ncbi:MAG: hypothetical protein U1F49_13095 [Rubrivivax sp.]